MSTRLIDVEGGRPLLDIASYARRGPGRRDRLSHDETELIERTVHRTPEVMVKVLTRGGQDLKAVGCHIAYLNRGGELEIETDDGQRLLGEGVETGLLEDWDLDLDERCGADVGARSRRPPPKLVHKLMFSMPAGTPPDKVLLAVKNFAREEFGLKHRYATVLHTDEPHPHVHMVIKAVSEQGARLNIKKATLRRWRRDFAQNLRHQGVPANATERAVRGANRVPTRDPIYRLILRGESRHMAARAEAVANEIGQGGLREDRSRSILEHTRSEVDRGWRAAADLLSDAGLHSLARSARRFADQLGQPETDRELLARELLSRLTSPQRRAQTVSR
jgi:hypothetical protein